MPRIRVSRARITALATSQDHVVHRRQLYDLGLSSDSVANRMEYDGWREILRNVLLCHRAATMLFAWSSLRPRRLAAIASFGCAAALPNGTW